MRTNVTDTSIDAFHAHEGKAATQRASILEFLKRNGGNWSIGELAKALRWEKSTVSPRLHEMLYETKQLVEAPRRRDLISNVMIRPVQLPPVQGDLFH